MYNNCYYNYVAICLTAIILLPHAHVQGVEQLLSAQKSPDRYRWKTGLYALRIAQKGLLALQIMHFLSAWLWFINHTHSTGATVHAWAQCRKGSSSHSTCTMDLRRERKCFLKGWEQQEADIALTSSSVSMVPYCLNDVWPLHVCCWESEKPCWNSQLTASLLYYNA